MSEFGTTTARVAAKEHRCEYCWGPILRGESHQQYKGVYVREFQTWRMHNECIEDCDLNCEGEFCPGEGPMPDRVLVLVKERLVQGTREEPE